MRSLLWVGGWFVLAGCTALDVGGEPNDGGQSGEFGPGSGGGVGALADASVSDANKTPPVNDGGNGLGPATCAPFAFTAAPNLTYSRASAAFAVAALRGGSWPDINRSLLSHDEFLSHFATSYGEPGPFARMRTGPNGAVVDLFVDVTPGDFKAPTHLIAVVDTSVSMRDDLDAAAEVVSQFGAHLSEAGQSGDLFSIVTWGSEALPFTMADQTATVVGEQAKSLSDAFRQHAQTLKTEQLPPGAGMEPVVERVEELLLAQTGEAAAAVVIVTDGGVAVDPELLLRWRESGVQVAFVEVAGPSDQESKPRTFHRDRLAALGELSGGLTFFATLANADDVVRHFDGSFRVGQRAVSASYSIAGILGLVEDDLTIAANATDQIRTSFGPVGRHVFTSLPVLPCDELMQGTVTVVGTDYEQDISLDATPSGDRRLHRLARIDELYQVLAGDCAAASSALPAGAELRNLEPQDADLTELVDLVMEKCNIVN